MSERHTRPSYQRGAAIMAQRMSDIVLHEPRLLPPGVNRPQILREHPQVLLGNNYDTLFGFANWLTSMNKSHLEYTAYDCYQSLNSFTDIHNPVSLYISTRFIAASEVVNKPYGMLKANLAEHLLSYVAAVRFNEEFGDIGSRELVSSFSLCAGIAALELMTHDDPESHQPYIYPLFSGDWRRRLDLRDIQVHRPDYRTLWQSK